MGSEPVDQGSAHDHGSWSRRRFLAGSGVVAGSVALGLGGCSDGSDGGGPTSTTAASAGGAGASTTTGVPDPTTGIVDAAVPGTDTIFGWIEEVFGHGVRRPGYPADRWAEGWIEERFRQIGLEEVRAEEVDARRWEPTSWSLTVTSASGTRELEGFPVPFAAPTEAIELELAELPAEGPADVAGRAALVDVPLITIPAAFLATTGSAPDDPAGR
ncbi:MAG: twin-arginine translocation signal domain-containing protein, partial [Actinobacteria bacterium]|nr:twin-arginine translocation signal domain-containing protein [Actinomycetota bacterium]